MTILDAKGIKTSAMMSVTSFYKDIVENALFYMILKIQIYCSMNT